MAENDIRRKVLIVDDEPNVRRLSHMILSKKFDVFEAENGIQAIEKAKAQKPYQLPSFQFLMAAKKRETDKPVYQKAASTTLFALSRY